MIPYWLLFGFISFCASLSNSSASGRHPSPLPFLAASLFIMLMIGLRYQVGADWDNYDRLFQFAGYAEFWRLLQIGDPGFQFVNWIVKQTNQDIWLVNLICAAVFTWGLQRFARMQADPWLALVVAIPYLVIVVAMGYTRQSVALGIVMAGLASLLRGSSVPKFALYVAVAALFHRTAVVVLPLAVFAADRNRFTNFLAGMAGCVFFYDIFLAGSFDQYVSNYVEAQMSSQGAAIRVLMNIVPASIFLLFREKFRFLPRDHNLWRNFSLAAWLLLGILFVLPSSTAVDRLALYIIPLQIAVLARMPRAFGSTVLLRTVIMAFSTAVLFSWLNFAIHADYWLPYRFYPFA